MTLLAAGLVEDALAGIASGLRLPVLSLALVALVMLAFELGRFATELWRRRPGRTGLHALARAVIASPERAGELTHRAPSPVVAATLVRFAAAGSVGERAAYERALAAYELGVQRRLDRTRLLVRAGPALGLMGTLIPLAPGLADLGRGDIASLAAELQTAFAATVVGLLVGTVAFALTLTRTRMYSEDLTALEEAIVAPLRSEEQAA